MQTIEAYGVGTEPNIAKNMLLEDAIIKVLKAEKIDYDNNKDLIKDHMLTDTKAFIDKVQIIKMDKFSGFHSIKAFVDVRNEYAIQQANHLIANKPQKEALDAKEKIKPKEEKIEVIVQAIGYDLDDAKNMAKSMAFDTFSQQYDTKYTNLDHSVLPHEQIARVVVSTFEIINQKEIRKGLYKLDVKVVVIKEKLDNKPRENLHIIDEKVNQ